MKKIFLLLLLLVVSVSASARKSYITVYAHSLEPWVCLMGDVPDGIIETCGFTYNESFILWESRDGSAADVLNALSEYGYEVESTVGGIGDKIVYFLLSKEIPSGNQTEIVGDVNNDSEVTVADVNAVVNIILGLAKSNPSIMKQLKEQLK